jgi:hypothetical protein
MRKSANGAYSGVLWYEQQFFKVFIASSFLFLRKKQIILNNNNNKKGWDLESKSLA